MAVAGERVAERKFLRGLYEDPYFPDRVLDQGVAILTALCERIEAER